MPYGNIKYLREPWVSFVENPLLLAAHACEDERSMIQCFHYTLKMMSFQGFQTSVLHQRAPFGGILNLIDVLLPARGNTKKFGWIIIPVPILNLCLRHVLMRSSTSNSIDWTVPCGELQNTHHESFLLLTLVSYVFVSCIPFALVHQSRYTTCYQSQNNLDHSKQS